MHLPPYQLIARDLHIPSDGDGSVVISRAFLLFLLRCLLAHTEFDEEAYFARNPDVRTAVAEGHIPSGRLHYIWQGYFEGRESGADDLDEAWYLQTYPDVAEALARGAVASAREHYRGTGIYEWRSPNPTIEPHLRAWSEVLRLSAHPPATDAREEHGHA